MPCPALRLVWAIYLIRTNLHSPREMTSTSSIRPLLCDAVGASAAGSVGDGGVVFVTLQPPRRAHPPQCSDAVALTIIATILF